MSCELVFACAAEHAYGLSASFALSSIGEPGRKPVHDSDTCVADRFLLLLDDSFINIQEQSRGHLDSTQERGASHAVQKELSKPILETRKSLPAVVRLLLKLRGAMPNIGRFYCNTMALAAIWQFRQSLPSQLLFMTHTDQDQAADAAIKDQLALIDDHLEVVDAYQHMSPMAEELCRLTRPDAMMLSSLHDRQREVKSLAERLSATQSAAAAAAQLHAELERQSSLGSSTSDLQVVSVRNERKAAAASAASPDAVCLVACV